MTPARLLVRTPSRLHFGLLGWGPGSPRQFGGLGLMIESPSIELTVESATSDRVEGPLAGRAAQILARVRHGLRELSVEPMRASIRVLQAPAEHVGLGVGTQLSMAIAAAVLSLAGRPGPSAEQLARLTGRGCRSGIGLHGFQHGGFLVDGGRKDDAGIPPLVARLRFPEDWSVLVVQPPGSHGLHGPDEFRAFANLPPIADRLTERLCGAVLLGVLPAIVERDLAGFGAALEEIQAQVGAVFAPAQGGCYSSPRAVEIIGALHRAGFAGCGQSSWGPTLYGFSDRPRPEVDRLADGLRRRLELERPSVIVTSAANHGARVEPT